jgi:branched-chain amino acid transport system ATP-binding protein
MTSDTTLNAPILKLDNITLSFGGVQALTDISFSVAPGKICSIIGPNGAGKSSMLNVINGVYRPQQGQITFAGKQYHQITPHQAAVEGIGRTFQNIALFKGMSTLENIATGRCLKNRTSFLGQAFRTRGARQEDEENRKKAEEILEFLEIQSIRKTCVGRLAYGLQKRVELGRALAAEPRLLLLDEPMAGMNQDEKRDMTRFILEAQKHYRMTIVLIEHDLGVVMDISDHVVVLDYGRKIADGIPAEVRVNKEVIDAYLGKAHDTADSRPAAKAVAV